MAMSSICCCMDRHPFYAVGGANRQMALIADTLAEKYQFFYTCRRPSLLAPAEVLFRGIRHRVCFYDEKMRSTDSAARRAAFEQRYTNLLHRIDAAIYHARATIPNFPVAHRFVQMASRGHKLVFTAAHWFDCTLEHLPEETRAQYSDAIADSDIVTSLTMNMKAQLEERYNREVIFIPSGHPISVRWLPKSEPPIILWLGRLNAKWRRPELFIKLAQRLTDVPAQFVLIGPGSSYPIGRRGDAGRPIANAARKLSNLKYIPGVRPGEDNAWIAQASALVNTSSHEGFPNTYIQAWLRRTPVASMAVDPDQVIERNGLGVCVYDDLDMMEEIIRQWVHKPEERQVIGDRCHDYAITHHDIRRTAEQFARVYDCLLEHGAH